MQRKGGFTGARHLVTGHGGHVAGTGQCLDLVTQGDWRVDLEWDWLRDEYQGGSDSVY